MTSNKRYRRLPAGTSKYFGLAAPPESPRTPSFPERVRYRFDLALARGPLVVIGYLAVITVAIVLVAALLLTVLHLSGVNGGGKLGFADAFWQSLLRMLDTGTFASDQDWPTRVLSLIVTLSGIFLAGSLIGLIANAIDQRVDKLRKGRSAVLETGHTLVLGWSARLPTILSELVIANSNHRRQAVVVLSDKPKDEMEDELHRLVPNTKTTRVVCRTGDVGSIDDLQLVNIEGARSVIVLAGDQGDAGVVKAVLAVRSIDPGFERVRVVAELDDAHHAETLRKLTDDRIATVRADDVISQVTAESCHQDGLASVFRDLLDFDGDEIYFGLVPELVGHTYRDAVGAFEQASVIGLLRHGRVRLNPPCDEQLADGDEVIAIAADDDRLQFSGFVDTAVPPAAALPFQPPVEHLAIVGWSALGLAVLRELDQFVGAGSTVDVLVDRTVFAAEEITLPDFERCAVRVHALEPGPQAMIDVLRERCYDHAIVLGYRRRLDSAQADARSMLTLLALQRAFHDQPKPPRVVVEMLDRLNVAVAQTTGVDDFIVSDELSSLMIAQLSERLELQQVFRELFASDGCSVSLYPATLYVATDHPTRYRDVVAAGLARGHTVIGYRQARSVAVMNPPKSSTIEFGADDQVLVLATRATRRSQPPRHPDESVAALPA